MSEHKTISIARDFSETPIGRYRSDGKNSGAVFRDDILVPALRVNSRVTVDLSGTAGYGSSFLEETFGGLIRECGFTLEQLRAKLTVVATDPMYAIYKQAVDGYMKDAEQIRQKG
jgi:hypothetical protein